MVKLAIDLFKDPEVLKAVTELALTVINKQEMTDVSHSCVFLDCPPQSDDLHNLFL